MRTPDCRGCSREPERPERRITYPNVRETTGRPSTGRTVAIGAPSVWVSFARARMSSITGRRRKSYRPLRMHKYD